jgi:hypothetical protein
MPTIQTMQREGNVRLRIKKDGTLVNEQDFHIRIRADNLTQSREEILLNTPGTPKFGTIYGNYGMTLQGCDGSFLDEDPLLWDCVFNLSNSVEEGESSNQETGEPQIGDPTEWIPVIDLGFEDYEEVFFQSLLATREDEIDVGSNFFTLNPAGFPVFIQGTAPAGAGYNAYNWVNSAGAPYDSGFVRQRRIITRKFVQFEPMFGPRARTLDELESWNDTLNAVEYLGRPPRTLKLSLDGVSAGFYYGMRCWRVDCVIAYKPTDWRLKVLDVGWYYLNDADPREKIQFEDDSPTPSNIQGALDGAGGKAADQLNPAIRAHKEFESLEFANFLRLE